MHSVLGWSSWELADQWNGKNMVKNMVTIFGTVGQCKVPLKKEISIKMYLFISYEVLRNGVDFGLDKTQQTNHDQHQLITRHPKSPQTGLNLHYDPRL